jgi:hypothetical protein
MQHRTDFQDRSTGVVHSHNFTEFYPRNEPTSSSAWAARNERNQAGPSHGNRMLQVRTTALLANAPESYAKVLGPAGAFSAQGQEGFAKSSLSKRPPACSSQNF